MQVDDLKSWDEFEHKLNGIYTSYSQWPVSDFLFRGQSDAQKPLRTTLERLVSRLSLRDYYALIRRARPRIETFTDKTWHIPTLDQYEDWLKKHTGNAVYFEDFPAFDYMIYLRHHGFPSPLLDWTSSQYIAAFFAFREKGTEGFVSIYVLVEQLGPEKRFSTFAPTIHVPREPRKTHKRHFLQQSKYTICTELDDKGLSLYYTDHEKVAGDEGQDRLWKFNIPSTERVKVLKILDKYNINAHSLFGSEESLIETIAMREFLKAELL